MALDFHIFSLDQVDGGQVYQVTLGGGKKLSRGDFIQVGLHFLAGLPGFQGTAVGQIDFHNVAMAFQKKNLGDFFYPDSSAYQPKDDFGAAALPDIAYGPVQGFVELGLGKGFQQIIRGLYGKSVYGKFVAGGQEDDFRLAVFFPEGTGHLGAQNARHAHIQQDDIERAPLADGIDKGEAIGIGPVFHGFFFVL